MINVFCKKKSATLLKISVETLDRYRKSGKLAYRQIGDRILFTENDLIAFLEACVVPATAIPTAREKTEMAKAAGGEK